MNIIEINFQNSINYIDPDTVIERFIFLFCNNFNFVKKFVEIFVWCVLKLEMFTKGLLLTSNKIFSFYYFDKWIYC